MNLTNIRNMLEAPKNSWNLKDVFPRFLLFQNWSSRGIKNAATWKWGSFRCHLERSGKKLGHDNKTVTPPKINMEPQNWQFVDVSPFQKRYFQVPCLFWGVLTNWESGSAT